MANVVDLTGQVFHRLTVLHRAPENSRHGKSRWVCRCQCGATVTVVSNCLRSGNTRSCGCWKREVSAESYRALGVKMGKLRRTHGHTTEYQTSPTYLSWCGMKLRCTKPSQRSYKDYGGRGITICDRWLNSFESFLEDMGERPPGMTLDRIDVDGNYELGNCRWATTKEQRANQHDDGRRRIEVDGVSRSIAEWAEVLGVGYTTIRARIEAGWPEALAVTAPKGTRYKPTNP